MRDNTVNFRPFFSEKGLAERWGITPKTLQSWRQQGRGPRYIKIGASVRYMPEAVDEFEASGMHDPLKAA